MAWMWGWRSEAYLGLSKKLLGWLLLEVTHRREQGSLGRSHLMGEEPGSGGHTPPPMTLPQWIIPLNDLRHWGWANLPCFSPNRVDIGDRRGWHARDDTKWQRRDGKRADKWDGADLPLPPQLPERQQLTVQPGHGNINLPTEKEEQAHPSTKLSQYGNGIPH